MALQSSGAISISDIQTELGSSSGSLRTLSAAAGFSTPDSMSEFYGYSSFSTSTTFEVATYTGNGTSQSITLSGGFQPDLVWIKGSNPTNHYIFNSIKGAGYKLWGNSQNAYMASSNELTSFNSNGFSVGSSSFVNGSGHTYKAYCWKAANGTASNTNGSITSTVSAFPAAGFSIVTYSGAGSGTQSVGHGLSSAPSAVIIKKTNGTGDWRFKYNDSGHKFVDWNQYYDFGSSSTSLPTSSVFYPSTASEEGASGGEYIAICIADVSGFSKVSKYVGSGASGNTQTVGFQPKLILRAPINLFGSARTYDGTYAFRMTGTGTVNDSISFTSTGFTFSSAVGNDSGFDWVYWAFGG